MSTQPYDIEDAKITLGIEPLYMVIHDGLGLMDERQTLGSIRSRSIRASTAVSA